MTVHLVNLTNPMMMKGPLREVIPGRPPDGAHPAARRHARAEGPAADRRHAPAGGSSSDGAITVTVPSVDVHEVIAIDT